MRLTVIATADGEILAFMDAALPAARFAGLRAQVAATGLRWHTLTLPPRLAACAHAGHLRTLLAGHRVRLTHGIPYLALVAPDPPRRGFIIPATMATRTTTRRATRRPMRPTQRELSRCAPRDASGEASRLGPQRPLGDPSWWRGTTVPQQGHGAPAFMRA